MQSPVFLVNSRLCLVSATTQGFYTPVAPLLPKLRGQLAEFLNDSYPAHLSLLSQSTCVGFGYGRHESSLEAFPGSTAINTFDSLTGASPSGLTPGKGDFPPSPGRSLGPPIPSDGAPSSLRHSIVITDSSRDRISNLLSISYASRPRLRSRLTLGGSTFPRNPWTSGECDSHTLRATHAGILSSMQSTNPRRVDFSPHTTLPYRFGLPSNLQASAPCLAPCIFGATILDQ